MFTHPALHFHSAPHPSLSWSPDGRLSILPGHAPEREVFNVLYPSFPPRNDRTFNLLRLGDEAIASEPKVDSDNESEVDSDEVEGGVLRMEQKITGVYALAASWSPAGLGRWRESLLGWIAGGGYVGVWEVGEEGWKERWNLQNLMEEWDYEDYKTKRMRKMRRRGACLAWSFPVQEGVGWGSALLAVGNDAGEMVVFRVSRENAELVTVLRIGISLDYDTRPDAVDQAPSGGNQRVNMEDDGPESMDDDWQEGLKDLSIKVRREPRPISAPINGIAWSPWITNADETRFAYVAATHKGKVNLRTVSLDYDRNLIVSTENFIIGEAWTEEHPIQAVQWLHGIYRNYVVLAYVIQTSLKLVFIRANATELIPTQTYFVQTYANGYIDAVAGLEFLRLQDGIEVHLAMVGGGAQVIRPIFPEDDIQLFPPKENKSWPVMLEEARQSYKVQKDVLFSRIKIYGLVRSPLGSVIGTHYSCDADWALVYPLSATERSKIAFSNDVPAQDAIQILFGDKIPTVFDLTSEAFLTEVGVWNVEGYELLKEKFRKKGLGKDLDLGAVQVSSNPEQVVSSFIENIYHTRSLSISRYQALLRLLPQHQETTKRSFDECLIAVHSDPTALAHLLVNVLLAPKALIVYERDISSLYSVTMVAMATFSSIPLVRELVTSTLTFLERKTGKKFASERKYLTTRTSSTATPPALPPHAFESCSLCTSPLLTTDLIVYECSNSHRIARCSLTALPVRAGGKKCGICKRMALGESKESRPEKGLVDVVLEAWDVCPYCGGGYRGV